MSGYKRHGPTPPLANDLIWHSFFFFLLRFKLCGTSYSPHTILLSSTLFLQAHLPSPPNLQTSRALPPRLPSTGEGCSHRHQPYHLHSRRGKNDIPFLYCTRRASYLPHHQPCHATIHILCRDRSSHDPPCHQNQLSPDPAVRGPQGPSHTSADVHATRRRRGRNPTVGEQKRPPPPTGAHKCRGWPLAGTGAPAVSTFPGRRCSPALPLQVAASRPTTQLPRAPRRAAPTGYVRLLSARPARPSCSAPYKTEWLGPRSRHPNSNLRRAVAISTGARQTEIDQAAMCGDSVRPCHYTVLGVARCASAADIYAAYHKKVEVSAVHTRAFPLVTNVTRMRGGSARRSYAGRSAVFFFCAVELVAGVAAGGGFFDDRGIQGNFSPDKGGIRR